MTGGGARNPGPRPLFVERQTYRRRRLADSARMVPVLGAALWMLPLLWGLDGEAMRSSTALVYLFAVWIGLSAAAGLVIWLLRHRDTEDRAEDGGEAP